MKDDLDENSIQNNSKELLDLDAHEESLKMPKRTEFLTNHQGPFPPLKGGTINYS